MGWHWYETPTGSERALKEFRKGLLRDQQAALMSLMERYAADELLPRQLEHVGGKLWALRTTLDGVELRLYFGKLGKHDAVCLAVRSLNKKTRKIPAEDLQLAYQRVAEWEKRHSAELKSG